MDQHGVTSEKLRVLVLGAYGFFGGRIATALTQNPRLHLILAGRDLNKATALAYQLGLNANHAKELDATDPRLALQLKKLGLDVLIHTAGPFQRQGYDVAKAAIEARCHYFDLADGRAFVTGITRLDAAARAAQVSVVSGVSSLPALSSAVVDRYLPEFSRLDSIRIGISSGARVPGIATVRGIFDYCGQPIRVLENGQWIEVRGWLDRHVYEFPRPIGERMLGRCDVPDLTLLPARYPGVKTVSFHAGFASDTGHKLVELLARSVRDGRLKSAQPFARAFFSIARRLESWLSDSGAMYVKLDGLDKDGQPESLNWMLTAHENHGPNIPCGPAIALTNKWAAGFALPAGAMPCMGLLSVEEILEPLKKLRIRELAPTVMLQ
jgi:saccharopine dehydrogenase-like NADP-dependent oxidoreductase